MEIEMALGADIAMCLDECTAYPCSFEDAKRSADMSTRVGGGCRRAHNRRIRPCFHSTGRNVLRVKAGDGKRVLVSMDLPGYAIGGLSVGSPGPHVRGAGAHRARGTSRRQASLPDGRGIPGLPFWRAWRGGIDIPTAFCQPG